MKVVFNELGFEHEVLGWVAGNGKLGECDNVGILFFRAVNIVDDLVTVASEVADRRVYLGHGNADCSHETPF